MKWIGKHNIFDDLMIGGVLLTPPDPTYEYELTLPNNDGSSGQVLTTDGNGLLSWTTVATGSGVTMTNGVNDRVMTATGAASITGDSALTFNNTDELLTIGDVKIRGEQNSYNGSLVSSYIELPSVNAFGSGLGAVFKVADTTGTCSGAGLWIEGGDANGTNQAGGNMHFKLGTATGSGATGVFEFLGGSGSQIAKIYDTGLRLPVADQAIVFEGGSYDTTLKAQTSVGAARTITLPDADGTVALTSDIPALSVPVTIGQGGTGQTTQQAAIDALTAVSGASTGQRLTKDGSGNATWADATTETTINGTTTNGVATYGGANTIDIESKLTFNGSTTLTIGSNTSSSLYINSPALLAGQGGHRLNFVNGESGSGTNIIGGQQTFWSGLGTGNKPGGMYSFLGAPADNLAGGTGRSREGPLYQIFADAGASNTAYTVLYDVNDIRNYFSTQVKADGVTVLTTVDDSSHNADLAIVADGAVSISSTDASNDILLNSAGEIELNADGGNIDFKDNTARLAKIDTDGLSFQDNTGAGIKFEGATDNANQTTLSVVDPTGTRTINLPDDSGTVALQEKSIIVKNMGFYNTSTSAFYLPMLEYIAESTYVTSYVSSFVAPYDGKVIKVGPGWSNNSSSKTSTYKFFKNKQSSTQTGTTHTTTSFTTTIPEVTPTDWTFSKGEPIHIQCTNSATIQSVSMTVTIELDLTT